MSDGDHVVVYDHFTPSFLYVKSAGRLNKNEHPVFSGTEKDCRKFILAKPDPHTPLSTATQSDE